MEAGTGCVDVGYCYAYVSESYDCIEIMLRELKNIEGASFII